MRTCLLSSAGEHILHNGANERTLSMRPAFTELQLPFTPSARTQLPHLKLSKRDHRAVILVELGFPAGSPPSPPTHKIQNHGYRTCLGCSHCHLSPLPGALLAFTVTFTAAVCHVSTHHYLLQLLLCLVNSCHVSKQHRRSLPLVVTAPGGEALRREERRKGKRVTEAERECNG